MNCLVRVILWQKIFILVEETFKASCFLEDYLKVVLSQGFPNIVKGKGDEKCRNAVGILRGVILIFHDFFKAIKTLYK